MPGARWRGRSPRRDNGLTIASGTAPGAHDFDLVVIGAGMGGLTAALVGALRGCRVLLIEKSDRIGGTAARSSGTVWIPNNPEQVGSGIDGDDALALAYLDELVGERSPRVMREAFVAAGPAAVRFLRERTDIRFR